MCNFLDSVANGLVAGIIICSQQGHGFISPGGGSMVCVECLVSSSDRWRWPSQLSSASGQVAAAGSPHEKL